MTLISLVLYSFRSNLWKITDFGITSDAGSKKARPSRFGRGTASYRAPELLTDSPEYTTKVDIWGLGCILYELVCHKRMFLGDWHVYSWFTTTEIALTITIPKLPKQWHQHLIYYIGSLSARDPGNRPSAFDVRDMFRAYCIVWNDFNNAQAVYALKSLPSFLEWKRLVQSSITDDQLLYRISEIMEENGCDVTGLWQLLLKKNTRNVLLQQKLANALERKGDNESAVAIWKDLVRRDPYLGELQERLANATERVGDPDIAVAIWKELAQENPVGCGFQKRLAAAFQLI